MQTCLHFGGMAYLEEIVGFEQSQRSEVFLLLGCLKFSCRENAPDS
jgi:hypothetical protein